MINIVYFLGKQHPPCSLTHTCPSLQTHLFLGSLYKPHWHHWKVHSCPWYKNLEKDVHYLLFKPDPSTVTHIKEGSIYSAESSALLCIVSPSHLNSTSHQVLHLSFSTHHCWIHWSIIYFCKYPFMINIAHCLSNLPARVTLMKYQTDSVDKTKKEIWLCLVRGWVYLTWPKMPLMIYCNFFMNQDPWHNRVLKYKEK